MILFRVARAAAAPISQVMGYALFFGGVAVLLGIFYYFSRSAK
jgi:hypothetical protein